MVTVLQLFLQTDKSGVSLPLGIGAAANIHQNPGQGV